jgi:hypothetical protein
MKKKIQGLIFLPYRNFLRFSPYILRNKKKEIKMALIILTNKNQIKIYLLLNFFCSMRKNLYYFSVWLG